MLTERHANARSGIVSFSLPGHPRIALGEPATLSPLGPIALILIGVLPLYLLDDR